MVLMDEATYPALEPGRFLSRYVTSRDVIATPLSCAKRQDVSWTEPRPCRSLRSYKCFAM